MTTVLSPEAVLARMGEFPWALDLETSEFTPSAAWADWVGLDAGPETPLRIEDLVDVIHSDDRSRFTAALEFARRHGHFETSHRLRRQNGDYTLVYDRSIGSVQGNGAGVLHGSMRPVGDPIAATILRGDGTTAALDQVSHAEVGYFTYTVLPDGTDRIEDLSPGCGALWGVSDAAIINNLSVVWDTVDSEDLERIRASVAESANRQIPWIAEYRVTTPSGEHKRLQGFGVPKPVADGGTTWQTVITDVTPIRTREREVAEANQLFSDLTANIPGAVFRYAIFADGSDAIEYMSDGCLALWEIDAGSLQNDPTLLWGMVNPDDLPDMQASVMASAQTLTNWVHRWRITTPSGVEKWLEGRGQPRRLEDGTTIWNTLIIDVSAEVRAEQELEQRDNRLRSLSTTLENVSRLNSMGELSSAIAHELNQPLAAAMNYAHAAEMMAEGPSGAGPIGEMMKKAVGQIERAADITSRLRSLFVKGKIATETRSLNEVVGAGLQVVLAHLSSRIVVERSLAEDLPAVDIDDIQMQLVALNLARNALQAMADQGRGTLRVSTFGVDGMVGFTVEDSGPGIPDDKKAEILTAFTSTKTDGSGVGLSICASIVKAHGGH